MRFLALLEKKRGGRPSVHCYNLFAAVLYGFAFGRDTVRDLADACSNDLCYIYIMEQEHVSYATVCRFINEVITPEGEEVFGALNAMIEKETSVQFNDAFVGGTKIEANANKYKFVWKPTTFYRRISATFFAQTKALGLLSGYREYELISVKTVSAAVTELSSRRGICPTANTPRR